MVIPVKTGIQPTGVVPFPSFNVIPVKTGIQSWPRGYSELTLRLAYQSSPPARHSADRASLIAR